MSLYKNVGNLVSLADGCPLAPGEAKGLSAKQAEDPYNKRLIDEGKLIPVEEPKGKKEGGDK